MTRIAFFGSPDFACTVLSSLHAYCQHTNHQIALVVCQPDRPRGRGQHMHAPAVKTLAQSYSLPIAQPNALKPHSPQGQVFLDLFRRCNIDLAVVASYGRIIPQALLELPEHGFINVHASLLPRWRGASPIQRALQEGDAKTGVSIMHMTPQLDAGDVYGQYELPILPHHDADSLQQDLAVLTCQVLPNALQRILKGTLKPVPQPSEGVTYAPLLTKQEGQIHFAQSAQAVVNHTRAMHLWPGVYAQHKTVQLLPLVPAKHSWEPPLRWRLPMQVPQRSRQAKNQTRYQKRRKVNISTSRCFVLHAYAQNACYSRRSPARREYPLHKSRMGNIRLPGSCACSNNTLPGCVATTRPLATSMTVPGTRFSGNFCDCT